MSGIRIHAASTVHTRKTIRKTHPSGIRSIIFFLNGFFEAKTWICPVGSPVTEHFRGPVLHEAHRTIRKFDLVPFVVPCVVDSPGHDSFFT